MSSNPVSDLIHEVINNGRFERIADLVTDDYQYRAGHVELHGPAQLEALLAAYRVAFPDLVVVIDEQLQQADRVVTRARFTGHHRGDFQSLPPTDSAVAVDLVIFSTLRDGRIAAEFELIDELALMQQLGVAV